MDSFTVAPELKGTKGDIMAARIEMPILVVMIYGIVEFIRLGWSQDYYLFTYAPVLGGVAASVGLFTYFFLVSVERKKSRKNLLVLFGFLPYFYSLYIMGVLGLYTIYEGIIGKFSASSWNRVGDVGLVSRLCLLRSNPSVRSAPSFRPDLHARYADARSGGQGWPAFGPPLQRREASLTAASTTA